MWADAGVNPDGTVNNPLRKMREDLSQIGPDGRPAIMQEADLSGMTEAQKDALAAIIRNLTPHEFAVHMVDEEIREDHARGQGQVIDWGGAWNCDAWVMAVVLFT